MPSAFRITRAGPSATPGEAAKPVSTPSALSEPPSQALTESEVTPQSITLNGSVMTSGGTPSAGGADQVRNAFMIVVPARDLPTPVLRAAGGHAHRPAVEVVEDRVRDLRAAEQEDVVGVRPEPLVGEELAELAHLAPDLRHAPVLDVEVVVLDVREDHPGQPELALERGLGLRVVDQLGVLRDDPVPLGLDRLDRPGQRLTAAELGDVGLDEVHRDVGVLGPDLVGVVEARARREVEPRVVRLLPLLQPLLAVVVGAHGRDRVGGAAADPVTHAEVDGELRELLELLVGTEQVDVDAGHHLGDGLVRDRRPERSCRSRRSRGTPRSRG